MKKLATLLLSATLLSGAAYADSDKAVATFKGGEVKASEIMTQFKDVLNRDPNLKDKQFSELESKLQEALVKAYVNTKLLAIDAKNSGIESSKEFQEKFASMKEQILQQKVIEDYLKKTVTDSMIDAEYNKLVDSLKDKEEIKASHILVDSEEKAKEAKKKLSKGSKFEDVVKEFSKDESTKASGGVLGYFREGQMVPEFEKKAFSMKVGEISDPVKTQFGWHVIKVEDKRKVKAPSKEEAKQEVVSKLNRDALEKFFDDLAKKYNLKML
jgi:parvulin-like peptidyl-prolyl isomerase